MKRSKLMLVASMAVLLAAACGKDDPQPEENTSNNTTNNETTTGKKLVKMSEFVYWLESSSTIGGFAFTSGWHNEIRTQWTGNKIANFTSYHYDHGALVNDGQMPCTYTGDRLTEISTLDGQAYLTWTGDRLTEVYTSGENSWARQTLTYSADGHLATVTMTNSYGSGSSEIRLTWTGDNVSAIQEYSDGEWESTTSYTYDSKKSPCTDVFYPIMFGRYEWFSANNVLRAEETHASINGNSTRTTTYTYTYNGDYPVKCTAKRGTEDGPQYVETTTYLEYSDGAGSEISVPQAYTIDVQTSGEEHAYVSGGGTYAQGKTATLYASSGYDLTFSRWSDENTDNPRNITVNRNMSLTAIFE